MPLAPCTADLQFLSVYPEEPSVTFLPCVSLDRFETSSHGQLFGPEGSPGSKAYIKCRAAHDGLVGFESIRAQLARAEDDCSRLPLPPGPDPRASQEAQIDQTLLRMLVSDFEDRYIDCFTGLLFRQPVVAEDGRRYEKTELDKWFEHHTLSDGRTSSPRSGDG